MATFRVDGWGAGRGATAWDGESDAARSRDETGAGTCCRWGGTVKNQKTGWMGALCGLQPCLQYAVKCQPLCNMQCCKQDHFSKTKTAQKTETKIQGQPCTAGVNWVWRPFWDTGVDFPWWPFNLPPPPYVVPCEGQMLDFVTLWHVLTILLFLSFPHFYSSLSFVHSISVDKSSHRLYRPWI